MFWVSQVYLFTMFVRKKRNKSGVISVVFYDVTTIYFQIDDEADLRKRGFSKEGKHQNPQIILGLDSPKMESGILNIL